MADNFQPNQIVIGENSLSLIGEIAKREKIKHLFVVMDNFLTTKPLEHHVKVKSLLEKENMEVTFFTDYVGEPSTDDLNTALRLIGNRHVDGVAAIGGGSAIDIAKSVALFRKSPNLKWEEITKQERLNKLPLIAVPTTAGTGSEATKIMVITDSHTSFKMNPGHPDLIPDIAILDPLLTSSLPSKFTAYTGMDALCHAIEAYASTNASIITDRYALNAVEIIGKSLPTAYDDGKNIPAREEMLLASTFAGIAFSNASTNLAHAAGRPLGARFNLPHGLSVSLLLPFVMEFGKNVIPDRYAQIAIALGEDRGKDIEVLADRSIELVERFNERFNIWHDGLKSINLEDLNRNIDVLVKDALSGNGILTNRIVPTDKDIGNIFKGLITKLTHIKEVEKV